MPEGDSLHRAARRLQVLVGERVAVETPHPRAAAERVAERLDGRTLEAVEAVGKNLLLSFEGGLVLRSHLRMSGRWQVVERGRARRGKPWLVLSGADREAVLWNGPVLELSTRAASRLGPDILAEPPDLAAMVANMRREPGGRELGDALLDQRLVAGVGNVWEGPGAVARAALAVAAARLGRRRRAGTGAGGGRDADARFGRGRQGGAFGVPQGRAPVSSLQHPDSLPRPGRRQPHGLLVPVVPAGQVRRSTSDETGKERPIA